MNNPTPPTGSVTATVSEPTPLPKRPELHLVLFPPDRDGDPWQTSSLLLKQYAEDRHAKYPGSVIVTIPSDSRPSVGRANGYVDGYDSFKDPNLGEWRLSIGDVEKARSIKGIIDCTGDVPVVRKVLGTLPVTADGFVVGGGTRLFAPSATDGGLVFDIHTPGPSLEIIDSEGTFTGEMWDLPEHCYSTKESAIEATKKGPS